MEDKYIFVAIGVLGGVCFLLVIAVSMLGLFLKHLKEKLDALKGENERPKQWKNDESLEPHSSSQHDDYNPTPQIPRIDNNYNTTAMRNHDAVPQQLIWPSRPNNADKPWLRPQQPVQQPQQQPPAQVIPKWKTSAVHRAPSESSRQDYGQPPSRFPGPEPSRYPGQERQNFGRNPMSGSGMDRAGY